jgi:hypothetical protein
VNDIDPGVDRLFEIVIGRAGTAMQSKRYTGRGLISRIRSIRQMLCEFSATLRKAVGGDQDRVLSDALTLRKSLSHL